MATEAGRDVGFRVRLPFVYYVLNRACVAGVLKLVVGGPMALSADLWARTVGSVEDIGLRRVRKVGASGTVARFAGHIDLRVAGLLP